MHFLASHTSDYLHCQIKAEGRKQKFKGQEKHKLASTSKQKDLVKEKE